MSNKLLAVLGMVAVMLLACSPTKDSLKRTIYIGAETKPCTAGVMKAECMQVKWEKSQKEWQYFYGNIDGFTYEKGYEYKLVISEEKVDNPPADASSVKYKLLKQISKKKVE